MTAPTNHSFCPRQNLLPSGPSFSRIVLGFWRLADWGWSAAERLRWVEQAVDAGVTTMDHADIYGGYATEALFGEMLRQAPALKNKVEIISKCDIRVPVAGMAVHTKHYDTSRHAIVLACERSLQQLGVEHLDLLLLHRPDPLMQADEVALAFDDLQRAGKARAFGVSNFSASQLALLQSRTALVTNQIECSLLHRTPLFDGTLDWMQQWRMRPMFWSALAGGRLFGEGAEAQRLRPVLQRLAEQHQSTLAAVALAWLLQLPSQPWLIHGSRRGLSEAVAATQLSLGREDWTALLQAAQGAEVP